MADPPIACGPLKNKAEMKGNIALVRRGKCSFIVKAVFTSFASGNAVGMILIDSSEDFYVHMLSSWNQQAPGAPGSVCQPGGPPDGKPPGCTPLPPIPCMSIMKTDGDAIAELIKQETVTVEIKTAAIIPRDLRILKDIYNQTFFVSQLNSALFWKPGIGGALPDKNKAWVANDKTHDQVRTV